MTSKKSPARKLLDYIHERQNETEAARFERCVRQDIVNERMRQYALRLEWCERSGGEA